MNASKKTPERTAGGLLGKVAGRAKEVAGSALGREDLHREGRLQQVQVEAEQQAAERARLAREKDEEAELAAARAETEVTRRTIELEASEATAEEKIERDAVEVERDARRAELAADAIDPEEKR